MKSIIAQSEAERRSAKTYSSETGALEHASTSTGRRLGAPLPPLEEGGVGRFVGFFAMTRTRPHPLAVPVPLTFAGARRDGRAGYARP